jgi:ATP-dependent DNA helicase PIF1
MTLISDHFPADTPAPESTVQLDEQQKEAVEAVKAGKSIYLSGEAGMGKSVVIREIQKLCNSRTVAPTGTAAYNVNGCTIHSFFSWYPGQTPQNADRLGAYLRKKKNELYYRLTELQILIIDEISMVSSECIEYIDQLLRSTRQQEGRSFGGVQIVAVGDFCQLKPFKGRDEKGPPAELGFKALAWRSLHVVTLKTQHRQKGCKKLGKLLSRMRRDRLCMDDIELLESREGAVLAEEPTYLCPTNAQVDARNNRELLELCDEADLSVYPMQFQLTRANGRAMSARMFEAAKKHVSGRILEAINFRVCVGARVMLLANLDVYGGLTNGRQGTVIDLDVDAIQVQFGKDKVWVQPHYRKFAANESRDWVGSVRQFPLQLAWAMTYHKAQGKSIKYLCLDVGRGASRENMFYTGLSRGERLDCITLNGFSRDAIRMDPEAIRYYEEVAEQERNAQQ